MSDQDRAALLRACVVKPRRWALAVMILSGVLFLCSSAAAQRGSPPPSEPPSPGPVAPDRPSVSAAATTIPPGFVQVEMGITHFQTSVDGVDFGRTESLATSARFGVGGALELQANYLGVVDITLEDAAGRRETANGNGDLDVATKLRLFGGESGAVRMAVLAGLTLPTGQEGFGSTQVDPRGALLLSGKLTESLELHMNAVVDRFSLEVAGVGQTIDEGGLTAALSMQLSKRWSSFVEFAGGYDLDGELGAANYLLAGVGFLAMDNFQADVLYGRGLTQEAFDWIAGFGVTFRLPR